MFFNDNVSVFRKNLLKIREEWYMIERINVEKLILAGQGGE